MLCKRLAGVFQRPHEAIWKPWLSNAAGEYIETSTSPVQTMIPLTLSLFICFYKHVYVFVALVLIFEVM